MSEAEEISTSIETPEIQASVDPIEEKARGQGWVGEEEFKSNPDNEGKVWRPAREFVERGEMIGEIRSVKSEMERMRATMRETMDQQAKAIRKQLEEKFQRQLDTAVDEGDKAAASKAAEELAKLKDAPEPEPVVPPAVEAFKSRNKWFSENATDPLEREMSDLAVALDMQLHRAGNENTESRLAEVEKRIRKIYPEKFGNPARERLQAVESSGQVRRPGKKSVPSLDSLGSDFQNVGKKLVRQGVFKSESEYVQSLIDTGAIDV